MRLDHGSPTPLYCQIAEALRYDIATGRIRAGESLPALRTAAVKWGVNLHTVRQAHQELERLGLVKVRGARGAVVVEGAGASTGPVRRFAERVAREAREKHGLSAGALADLLRSLGTAGGAGVGASRVVHVIECSDTQAEDLARQVAERYDVDARAWCLDRAGELPAGALVATYFHYNDLRRRAPERLESIRFVAIRPDAALAARVRRKLGRRGAGARVWMVEQDEGSARTIAQDVAGVLREEGVAPAPMVVARAGEALARAGARDALLVSPRMWGAMTEEQRKDERVVEVRYLVDEDDLARCALALGWSARGGAMARAGAGRQEVRS